MQLRLLNPISRVIFSNFHLLKYDLSNFESSKIEQHNFYKYPSKNVSTLESSSKIKLSNVKNCTRSSIKHSNSVTDLMLDNLGYFFFSIIGILIVSITRTHLGTNNQMDVRTKIEKSSSLDPFECYDLRVNAISSSTYKKILNTIKEYEKNEMTYGEFINFTLNEITPKRIKNGYYLDRIILTHYLNLGKKIPLDLLLVLLNMTLDCDPEERIRLLFMIFSPKLLKGDIHANNVTIRNSNFVRLVHLLQQTCQLVPESQIMEDSTKYPVQKYKKASAEEMIRKAQVEVKLQGLQEWTCQDVEIILKSKNICVWGECFQK